MNPRVPDVIKPLLEEYLILMETKLPGLMNAYYLHGSIALGAILDVLRQYYTFQEQNITSKAGAGAYGLTHLPIRWHRLIREAITIREQTKGTLYKSRIGRASEAVRFLRYIIKLCNPLS